MASIQGIDTPTQGTRALIGGTLIGLLVGIGLSFMALVLGLVLSLNHPELTEKARDLRFLAPFGTEMVLVLGLLAVPGVRRVGGGVLMGVAVGAAATLAVVGGLLAGSGIQR